MQMQDKYKDFSNQVLGHGNLNWHKLAFSMHLLAWIVYHLMLNPLHIGCISASLSILLFQAQTHCSIQFWLCSEDVGPFRCFIDP